MRVFYSRFYQTVLLFVAAVLVSHNAQAATDYRSVASGNWSSLSTWQESTNGGASWAAATKYPGQVPVGTVTIQSLHTVTVDVNPSGFGQGINAFVVAAGAILKDVPASPSYFFTITTLTISGTINLTNSVAFAPGYYVGIFNATVNPGASVAVFRLIFYGGTVSNNGTVTATGPTGLKSEVQGNTQFTGSGTFNINGLWIKNNSGLTPNFNGTFNETAGTLIDPGCGFVTGPSSTAIYNLSSITLSSNTSLFNTSVIKKTKQLVISGDVSNAGSFVASCATTKTISLSGSSTTQFGDTLKVNTGFVTTNSGSVLVGTLIGTGTFTQGANSTLLYLGASSTITTLNATASGNTVIYTGSANQTVANVNFYNLTLTGGGNTVKSLSGSISILGTVSIQSNNVFSCGAFDFSVGGDWNNSSTNVNAYVASTKTVTFNGSGSQTILNTGDPKGTQFNNLVINNTSASIPQITITAPSVIVTNALQMISGVVNYTTSTFQLGTSSAAANTLTHSGSSSSGWFYTTSSSGGFLRYFQTGVVVADGSVKGLLPVGTSTNFRPMYISCPTTPPTTSTTMKVTQVGSSNTTTIVNIADPPGANIIRQYQGSWVLVPNTTTGAYNLTAGGTGFGTVGNVNDLRLSLSSSVVGSAGTNSGTTSFPLVQRTGLTPATLNNTFYLGSVDALSSPLPVELVYFEGVAQGDKVELIWETKSELKCESFEVLRSVDGKEFISIGSVDGHGTSHDAHRYRMTDVRPEEGKNYYRLLQRDEDQETEILETIVVDVKGESGPMRVYPNPVSVGSEVTLVLSGMEPQTEQEVEVIDRQGSVQHRQKIKTDERGSFRGEIKPNLTPGLYVLKVNALVARLLID